MDGSTSDRVVSQFNHFSSLVSRTFGSFIRTIETVNAFLWKRLDVTDVVGRVSKGGIEMTSKGGSRKNKMGWFATALFF